TEFVHWTWMGVNVETTLNAQPLIHVPWLQTRNMDLASATGRPTTNAVATIFLESPEGAFFVPFPLVVGPCIRPSIVHCANGDRILQFGWVPERPGYRFPEPFEEANMRLLIKRPREGRGHRPVGELPARCRRH